MPFPKVCHKLSMSRGVINGHIRRFRDLNEQHQTVALLYAHGCTIEQIGKALSATPKTVKEFLRRCGDVLRLIPGRDYQVTWAIPVLAAIGAVKPYDLSASTIKGVTKEVKRAIRSRIDVALFVLQRAGKPMTTKDIMDEIFMDQLHPLASIPKWNQKYQDRFRRALHASMHNRPDVFFHPEPALWWIKDAYMKAESAAPIHANNSNKMSELSEETAA